MLFVKQETLGVRPSTRMLILLLAPPCTCARELLAASVFDVGGKQCVERPRGVRLPQFVEIHRSRESTPVDTSTSLPRTRRNTRVRDTCARYLEPRACSLSWENSAWSDHEEADRLNSSRSIDLWSRHLDFMASCTTRFQTFGTTLSPFYKRTLSVGGGNYPNEGSGERGA